MQILVNKIDGPVKTVKFQDKNDSLLDKEIPLSEMNSNEQNRDGAEDPSSPS